MQKNLKFKGIILSTRSKGFTLIELLFTLFLVSVILLYGLMSFSSLLSRNEKQVILDEIRLIVNYAKIQAINSGKTLCLSSLNKTANWSNGAQLLEGVQSSTQTSIVHQWQWYHPHWIIKWSGITSSEKIVISPDPLRAISNGHFNVINPHTKEEIVITLNRLGRVKIEEK